MAEPASDQARTETLAALAAGDPSVVTRHPWHAGRTTGRNLYAGDGADDLLGCMDTRPLAAYVVRCVNSHAPLLHAAELLLETLDGQPGYAVECSYLRHVIGLATRPDAG